MVFRWKVFLLTTISNSISTKKLSVGKASTIALSKSLVSGRRSFSSQGLSPHRRSYLNSCGDLGGGTTPPYTAATVYQLPPISDPAVGQFLQAIALTGTH